MPGVQQKQLWQAEARNPATPPAQLLELVWHGCGREVAGNPNTPVDLLLKLAARHFDAFLGNPVLPLLLLEDPGLFLKLSPVSLRRLLRREDLPETLLASLARHEDAEVRESAALHVRQKESAAGTDDEVLGSLAALRADKVALPELFELGLVPAWLSEPLAGAADAELRDFVISVLERSENSKVVELGELYRRAGAALPRPAQPSRTEMTLSGAEMRRLAAGGPWVRVVAARHPMTPPGTLARLARDASPAVRLAALRHPYTPEDALWAGSASVVTGLRRAVARNPAATDAMLARLAADPEPEVRQAVASHRYLEPGTLRVLAGDGDATIRARVARHRLTPAEVLEKLSADASGAVRRAAAANPSTPPAVFARLAADAEAEVRSTLGRRCDLPDDLLSALACDEQSHVRHQARYNRSNPRELIWELAHLPEHEREAVRQAVARGKRRRTRRTAPKPAARHYHFSFPTRRWQEPLDPHHSEKHTTALNRTTAPEVLARLAEENSEWVLSAVAGNRNTPVAALRKVMRHVWRTRQIQYSLGTNPNLPPDLIEEMAGHHSPDARSMVCHNTAVPVEVLARLARDADASVRRSVARNARTPVETLLALCADEDASVGRALLGNPAVPWSALERFLPLVERDAEWRQTLARRTELPREWRERLLRDPEVSVRLAFTGNAIRSREEFEILVADPEVSVRNALLQHSCTWSAASLEELAQTDDPLRLVLVARAVNITPALAERLAAHPAVEIRAAVAGNQAAPEAALRRLVGDAAPEVSQALRNHPRCPPEEVDGWLEKGLAKGQEIYTVLHCPGLREHHYRKLLASGDEHTRQAIVFHERTPLNLLEELLDGKETKDLQHIARGRRLPDRMYEAIIQRENDGSLRHYTASSYYTPREVVERIALTGKLDDFWEGRTRVAIARRPDMGADFLCRLLDRELAAPRQEQTYRMRRRYYHREMDVVPVLAARPEIPVARLEPLLEDGDANVRRALINRADLPEAWRKKLRAAALQRSVEGRTSWARLAALCHPETKAEALRAFARTGRWLERLAVIRNPAAPADAIKLLGADSNRVIRAEARARLQTIQRSKS